MTQSKDEIVVIGLGFVGLTLSVFLGTKGKKVLGIESNPRTLEKLRLGRAHFYEDELSESLERIRQKGLLDLHESLPKRSSGVNRIYIITVGTPLINGNISSTALESAAASIFLEIQNMDCIVIRSTVGIGMTRRLILNPLASMGIEANVVVAPERTIEGVALSELAKLPQIVGGDRESTFRIQELFNDVGVSSKVLDSLEAAEFAKLMSNSFRDLLFGASNEYAMFADHLGLDFDEILDKSKDGYERLFALARPGPVAGPCLSKDPKIFSRSADSTSFRMKITEASREQNENLAKHIVQNIVNTSKDGRIGILGLAFKGVPETDDTRDSFVNLLLRELSLEEHIQEVQLWDPIQSKLSVEHLHGSRYMELAEIISSCDLVLIQNSNRYFSSPEFVELLNNRDKPEKLMIYQLWNILPVGSTDSYEVKSLSNFRHNAKRE